VQNLEQWELLTGIPLIQEPFTFCSFGTDGFVVSHLGERKLERVGVQIREPLQANVISLAYIFQRSEFY
jgi:transposase